MVETRVESPEASVTDYVLICSDKRDSTNTQAIGLFQNEEEANGAALVNLMQYIEMNIKKWPKLNNQGRIIEICRQIKDIETYKTRMEYLTLQCQELFKDHLHIQFQILPIQQNSIPSQPINESLFKIKVRNFLDAVQTKSDIEEDLNSEDDDEEDEEVYDSEDVEEDIEEDVEEDTEAGIEEDVEEDLEEEVEEEDLEEESEGVEEDESEGIEDEGSEGEEEEPPTSEIALNESGSEEEEEEASLKRKSSVLEEDEDEEDEIEEEADEDELEDDEETTKKRKSA